MGSIASLKGIYSEAVSKHSEQTKKQSNKENKHLNSSNASTEINSFLAIKAPRDGGEGGDLSRLHTHLFLRE